MNIPKKIIDTAIRGGWKTPFDIPSKLLVFATLTHEEYCGIALDPAFWQALGKALGWPEFEDETGHYFWRVTAHDFYDLILTGGDVQAFWDSLLTNPQP